MRPPIRPRRAAGAALSAGILLAAGCAQYAPGSGNGTEGTADAREVLLLPAAAQGPAPFTASTARSSGPAPTPTHTGPPGTSAPGGRTVHTLAGSTPGLYGGTRSVGSCDVGKQIRFLTADRARRAAFAQASGIAPADVPDFLHGLTPVLLRADTRVANHGFSGGAATTFQSVLQAGTAVMVDRHGLPRVRCAGGNPLTPPAGGGDAAAVRGRKWAGYDPARVVVVEPAPREVTDLVIVDVVNHRWIERPAGDEGASDHAPEVPPPYGPGADITGPLPAVPPAEPKPSTTTTPTDCPTTGPPPPREEAAMTGSPSGDPSGTLDAGRAQRSDCPTALPSDDPSAAPSGFPPDEPTGTPAEPDEPPQDLVPLMTEEPQTAIELPWPEGAEDGIEPVTG